jgi:tetratricopeptide (TPR) repeat protein
MKYNLILLFIILDIARVEANYENDSLISIISYNTGIERITALNQLSRNYTILFKSDSALKLALTALKESEKNENEINIAESYISICFHSFYYNFSKLKEYSGYLMKRSQTANYPKGIAYAYMYLSDLVADSSTVPAFNYLEKARAILESTDNTIDLAIVFWKQGDLFMNKSDYATALKYFTKSMYLFDNNPDYKNQSYYKYNYSMLCNSLGITFKNLNDFKNSSKYYLKYLELSGQLGEMWGVAISYNNLGNLEVNLNNNEKALNYYNLSKKLWDSLGIVNYHGDLYLNLGNVYLDRGKFDSAAACFDSSMIYFRKKDSKQDISKLLTCKGNLNAALKKYREAIEKYEESLKMNGKNGNLQINVENYKAMSSAYNSIKDYKNAYKYFTLYSETKDSLFNLEKATEVGKITANYEIQKRIEQQKKEAQEAALKEKEEIKRRNTIQYSGIIIFVAALFSFIFLSGKLRISDTALEVMVFVSLLLLFEFIQVVFDPLINSITNSEPFFLLLANLVIVAAIIPLDAYLERLMNKRIKQKHEK